MADSKQEIQAQANLQIQINNVLVERQKILKNQSKILSTQVEIAAQLCKALKCEDADEAASRARSLTEEMNKAAESAQKLGAGLSDAAGKGNAGLKKTSSATKTLSKQQAALYGGLIGFGGGVASAFKSAFSTISNLGSAIFGVAGSLGQLGMTILGAPFRILGGLIDMSQMGGGVSPLRLEIEKIRAEFGDLSTNEGAAAVSMVKQFRKQASNLAGTGLRLRRVFGPGREGLAKALAFNVETMKALGNAVTGVRDIFGDFAPELAAYRKGLGLSAEAQAQIIKNSDLLGQDPLDGQREFASMALQMGERFEVSQKLISKGMQAMVTDVGNFGTLTVREMGEAATYTAKLGIEVKELQGLISKFDNFEDAAVGAAKLGQAFGLNVDAMKLMNANNPAERLSMLQKAFKESGQSVEGMTRQQRKLLAAQTGLSDAAVKQAFSQKGLSMSYDDIQKAGGKAEKKQLSQQEVMLKLAKSIDRVFGSGGAKFKSFFDAFVQGLERGIMRFGAFRQMLRNIRKSLRIVYRLGIQVGREFVRAFPGVKKMVSALRDFFNPARFRLLTGKIFEVFRKFFRNLRADPKAGFITFIEDIKKTFMDFFGGSGTMASSFIEGGKEFLKAAFGIFQGLLTVAVNGLADVFTFLADAIRNPPEMGSALGDAFSALGDTLIDLFGVLADRVWPAVLDFFGAIWERIGPYVEPVLKTVLGLIVARALGTVLFSTIKGAVMGFVGSAAANLGKTLMQSLMTSGALGQGIKQSASAMAGAGPQAQKALSMMPSLAAFLGALVGVVVAFGVVAWIYKENKLKPEDAVALGVLMVALATSTLVIAGALKLVPKISGKEIGGLIMMGVFMGVLGVVAAGILEEISKIQPVSLETVMGFSLLMTTLVITTIPLIIAAAVIGAMQSLAGKALAGMVIMGLFMVAMGGLAAYIGDLIDTNVPNPAAVAKVMSAMADIMYATMVALPVAAILGAMLMAPPFGTAGVAIVAAGFGVLQGLALAMVTGLIPAIKTLSRIRIRNPESFKAVTGALLAIMESATAFIEALTGLSIVNAVVSGGDPVAFQKNLTSLTGLVDAIIGSGIQSVLNRLIEFAQSSNINEGTASALQGIGGIFSGIAGVIKAFSSPEAYKAIAEIGDGYTVFDQVIRDISIDRILKAMKDTIPRMADAMSKTLPAITGSLSVLFATLAGLPPINSNVAPLVSAVGSILSAVGTIMKSLMPGDAAFKAMTDFTEGEEIAARVAGWISQMPTRVGLVLDAVSQYLPPIMESISQTASSVAAALSGMSPALAKTVVSLVSTVLEAVTGLITGITPLMKIAAGLAHREGVTNRSNSFGTAVLRMKDFIKSLGPSIKSLGGPLEKIIKTIANIKINNPYRAQANMKTIAAALGAFTDLITIFGPGGPLKGYSRANKEGKEPDYISGAKHITTNMRRFVEWSEAKDLLRSGGLLESFVNLIGGINIKSPNTVKRNAKTITAAMEGFTSLTEGLSTITTASTSLNATGVSNAIEKLKNALGYSGEGLRGNSRVLNDIAGIINSVPTLVANRAEKIAEMATAIGSITTALNSSEFQNIASVVDLAEAVTQGRPIEVDHGSLRLNVHITVNMNADQLARGIVDGTVGAGSYDNGTRLSTTGPGGGP